MTCLQGECSYRHVEEEEEEEEDEDEEEEIQNRPSAFLNKREPSCLAPVLVPQLRAGQQQPLAVPRQDASALAIEPRYLRQ